MPTIYEIVMSIVSILSIIIALLSYRDKRSKEMTAALETIASKVEQRLQDLETKYNKLHLDQAVLSEQISHETKLLDKMDRKLDECMEWTHE